MYGFLHSNGKYIGFTCADEEVSAEDVFKLMGFSQVDVALFYFVK